MVMRGLMMVDRKIKTFSLFSKTMIFGFVKKLIKYYIDKIINWLRIKRFNLELDNDIKKYHEELNKKIKKPKIKEVGKFGEDGWSISIGDVEDGDS
jgi:hypothetical protein